MESEDEFTEHASGRSLNELLALPEPQGMAKRTRLKKPEAPAGAYAWEDELQRTWDIVKDDGGGRSLETVVQQMIELRKKKIMKNPHTPFQRGIIRTLVVVVDASLAMAEKDLRPTRLGATLAHLQEFVVEFFDQNPIAQMGIVLMRNGVAQVVSEVSGLPQHHVDKIRAVKARQHNRYEPKGDPLLQNALELARSLLNAASSHRHSKEVLVIFGALFTSDPGDIHHTIRGLAREHIRVKVIGLLAQVAICQEIVARTNLHGSAAASVRVGAGLAPFYGVIMHEQHFKELLMDCVQPLAVAAGSNAKTRSGGDGPAGEEGGEEEGDGVPLMRMGFPLRYTGSVGSGSSTLTANFPHLCACHPTKDSVDLKDAVTVQGAGTGTGTGTGGAAAASDVGYICPQCRSRVCSLPTVCPVCGLMLILLTHLARSYHHLVPLSDYREVATAPTYDSTHCYGCLLQFPKGTGTGTGAGPSALATSSRYRCGKCSHDFCIDCDVFVHEFLHNCPGCENNA